MRLPGRVPGLRALFLLLLLLVTPRVLAAQHGGGGGAHGEPPPGPAGPGFGGGGFGPGNYPNTAPPPRNIPDAASTTSTMRGGLQLGPPGRWWDDKHFAKDLNLRADQQHRMDSIFEANRGLLTKRLEDVHQEETRLESLVHSRSADEAALDAQIERRSRARADLEKAYTHYLLQIRSEMDADQLNKLEAHR